LCARECGKLSSVSAKETSVNGLVIDESLACESDVEVEFWDVDFTELALPFLVMLRARGFPTVATLLTELCGLNEEGLVMRGI